MVTWSPSGGDGCVLTRLSTRHSNGVVPGEISAVARKCWNSAKQQRSSYKSRQNWSTNHSSGMDSQATHIACTISDGTFECDYGCWVMAQR